MFKSSYTRKVGIEFEELQQVLHLELWIRNRYLTELRLSFVKRSQMQKRSGSPKLWLSHFQASWFGVYIIWISL